MQGVMLSEAILWIDQTEYKHSISINVPPSSKDFRSGEWCAFGGTSYGRRKASQYVCLSFSIIYLGGVEKHGKTFSRSEHS